MNLVLVKRLLRGQDRLLRLFGGSSRAREHVIATMLSRDSREAASYWLQLVVSIGIATLGLVLSSAAVVISAMLVAPLMTPIVALAMGLASGSPFLVLRAAGRVALSVVAAIGGAAAITSLLPFHEMNAEIAARTSPTLLDLLTAAFCALTGVYASVRPGSDTATTAAGASIGISLVPPLCASGYGLGTRAWEVAGGAAMLFITNLVAILVVGTIAYVALGFARVDVSHLERDEVDKPQTSPLMRGLYRGLTRVFESRAGSLLRFSMPLLLLAMTYVPLGRALDEVAWQVRARAAVRDLLEREPGQIVQTHVKVERGTVDLALMVLGTAKEAERTRAQLEYKIGKATGVTPRLEVLAVPDAKSFAGLESSLRVSSNPAPIVAPAAPSPAARLDDARSLIQESVLRFWPSAAVGAPLRVELNAGDAALTLHVRVTHLGPPLGKPGVEALERALADVLERTVTVSDLAISREPVALGDDPAEFIARVASLLRVAHDLDELTVCVSEPLARPERRRAPSPLVAVAATLNRLLDAHTQVVRTHGSELTVRITVGPCEAPASPTSP